ncbi:GNAT family N-acetyltransferase [Oleiphilus messinensis]|nr:GNAT family N-acetyltransferase [Oleiphilus messinensis]
MEYNPDEKNSLKSQRLILRPWRISDLPDFARLNADVEVMKYFPACLSERESNAVAERINKLILKHGWGFWALHCINDDRFIGFTGLHQPSGALPFSPCIEIGWRLDRQYWGKGLATEAARCALQFAFGELALDQVVSFTAVANHRSQAVMQRLGMKRDAENFFHPDLPPGHPLSEHVLYRLDAAEFRPVSDSS